MFKNTERIKKIGIQFHEKSTDGYPIYFHIYDISMSKKDIIIIGNNVHLGYSLKSSQK